MGKAGSGYKKPANKKSYTKKDIIQVSLFIAAIVALIAVFAIVVANDDFIRTKNGRLRMEDDWLIAQYARKNGTVWCQVGEVDDIEGFTLGSESAGSSVKYLYPDDPESSIAVIYVGAAVSDFEAMNASLTEGTVISYAMPETPATVELTLAGRDAVMTNCALPVGETVVEAGDETANETETEAGAADETAEETEAGTTIDLLPSNMIYACIEYDAERCIFIQINTYTSVTDEEAQTLVETVGSAITLIER